MNLFQRCLIVDIKVKLHYLLSNLKIWVEKLCRTNDTQLILVDPLVVVEVEEIRVHRLGLVLQLLNEDLKNWVNIIHSSWSFMSIITSYRYFTLAWQSNFQYILMWSQINLLLSIRLMVCRQIEFKFFNLWRSKKYFRKILKFPKIDRGRN